MELSHIADRAGRLSSFLREEMGMSAGLMNRLKWKELLFVNGVPRHTDYPVEPGDVITLRNADLQTLELTVSGIYDNHVENYAIISPETIVAQWGEAAGDQMAFIRLREGQDSDELSGNISGMSGVLAVSASEDFASMVSNMMTALDNVVWIIVFCAGALAVIVLYNLTNININERLREIATIKVLGFNATETAMYIFKENLTLTVAGSLFGLVLGKLMLLFVMTQIKIDMVWFKAIVLPPSYMISAVLFIRGIKLLGKAETASKGNLISAVGMLVAVLTVLVEKDVLKASIKVYKESPTLLGATMYTIFKYGK